MAIEVLLSDRSRLPSTTRRMKRNTTSVPRWSTTAGFSPTKIRRSHRATSRSRARSSCASGAVPTPPPRRAQIALAMRSPRRRSGPRTGPRPDARLLRLHHFIEAPVVEWIGRGRSPAATCVRGTMRRQGSSTKGSSPSTASARRRAFRARESRRSSGGFSSPAATAAARTSRMISSRRSSAGPDERSHLVETSGLSARRHPLGRALLRRPAARQEATTTIR